MRRSGRHLVVAVVAVLAVAAAGALTGCVPGKPAVTPAPTSTSGSPVFASDEEALAAAEEAYRAYLAVSDQILNEGGVDSERIAAVSRGELYELAIGSFEEVQLNEWRTVGSSFLANFIGQQVDLIGDPAVVAYVCVDVSDVEVLDALGVSQVAPDRPDLQAFQVSFEIDQGEIVPTAREPWTADGVC